MKNLLFAGVAATAIAAAGSAGAADIPYPLKGPLIEPAPAFTWTGCHVGTHSGLGAGHTTWRDQPPNLPFGTGFIDANGFGETANTDMSGAVYGGQIGCDWQFSNWVAGIEGSLSRSDITGTNMDQFNFTWTLRDRADWFGGVTGRVGWAVDRVLVYTRAGVAWARNQFEIENTQTNLGTPTATRTGWTIGSGIEWAFAPCWSAFIEADYYSFDAQDVRFPGNPFNGAGGATVPFTVHTGQTIETLKFGVNYRFGGGSGPVVARF